MSERREIEIHIGPNGRRSKVLLDGKDVPGVQRVVIDCSVFQSTRIELHMIKAGDAPLVIKGYMVEDPDQPSLTGEVPA